MSVLWSIDYPRAHLERSIKASVLQMDSGPRHPALSNPWRSAISASVSANFALSAVGACSYRVGALIPLLSLTFRQVPRPNARLPFRCPLSTAHCHVPLRLTALDSSAYSPFREPRRLPIAPAKSGCSRPRAPAVSTASRLQLDCQGQVPVHGQGKFWRTPEARARDARSFHRRAHQGHPH